MKILGISGKKRSGKNAVANFLNGCVLKNVGGIRDFKILDNGELNVFTQFKDGEYDWGLLDLYRKDYDFISSAEETIWPYVKNYSFADSLKSLGVNLFDLKPSAVYGTEEERAAPTHLMWENMPGNVRLEWDGHTDYDIVVNKKGPMSGREFLQYFGTEIGRKMYPPIWINATIKNILSEKSGLAIITDIRFPDEIAAVKKAGGYVFRLNRSVEKDLHISENALDQDVYDWDNFDIVIDNQNITLEETCNLVERYSRSFGII
jgi:hypothetical protein